MDFNFVQWDGWCKGRSKYSRQVDISLAPELSAHSAWKVMASSSEAETHESAFNYPVVFTQHINMLYKLSSVLTSVV